MKKKHKVATISSWLEDPLHISQDEMMEITIKDFHIYLHASWETYLKQIDQPCFDEDLTIFIITPHEHAHEHLLTQSPRTNFMFDITQLSEYPNLFHDFTVDAKLPFYLLHQEHEGSLLASFNPYTWGNATVCQAKEIAEFQVIALQEAEGVLPQQWHDIYFGPTPFLHFNFGHDMGEALTTWDDYETNELHGWITNPQRDT